MNIKHMLMVLHPHQLCLPAQEIEIQICGFRTCAGHLNKSAVHEHAHAHARETWLIWLAATPEGGEMWRKLAARSRDLLQRRWEGGGRPVDPAAA